MSLAFERFRALARSDPKYMMVLRLAVLLLAMILLYVRIPDIFRSPQFWAEDGDFFSSAYKGGFIVFTNLLAGYLLTVQSTIAVFASYFNPVYAASIYCYAAILITGLVVWIVTSPRLDLPCKFLLSFAIVLVPMGHEELGNLANTQWILPIGAFAFILMRPSRSVLVLLGEMLFVGTMALSGPFSIFLVPVFVSFWYRAAPGQCRSRLLLLGGVCSLGAMIQILVIFASHSQRGAAASVPYDWRLWLNLPFSRVATDFGSLSSLFVGDQGILLSSICIVAALCAAAVRPYRLEKISIIYFSAAVAIGGMYKFNGALGTQVNATRYFYAGSIFLLWFIAFTLRGRRTRYIAYIIIAATELSLIPAIADTPLSRENFHWTYWAGHLDSGVPVIVPISPGGFYIDVPPYGNGPLARYAASIGQGIMSLGLSNDTSCEGTIDSVSALPTLHFSSAVMASRAWMASGTVTDKDLDGIAVTNDQNRVIGFGFPGYPGGRQATADESPQRWKTIFTSAGGQAIRAYAIRTGGLGLCPLSGLLPLPGEDRPASSSKFVMGAPIKPGQVVVQRFSAPLSVESISVQFVDWGHVPSRYTVKWRIEARSESGSFQDVGAGTIDASTMADWQPLVLPISLSRNLKTVDLRLSLFTESAGQPEFPLGVPLFDQSDDPSDPPALIDGVQAPQGARLKITRLD